MQTGTSAYDPRHRGTDDDPPFGRIAIVGFGLIGRRFRWRRANGGRPRESLRSIGRTSSHRPFARTRRTMEGRALTGALARISSSPPCFSCYDLLVTNYVLLGSRWPWCRPPRTFATASHRVTARARPRIGWSRSTWPRRAFYWDRGVRRTDHGRAGTTSCPGRRT